MPHVGIGGVGNMKDVELGAMLLRKVKGVKKSNVGVL